MREIKLRAWNGHNMEYPVYDISKQYGSSKAKPYILMQYTGLLDKNGVEIYEGDIVQTTLYQKKVDADDDDYSTAAYESFQQRAQVVFIDGRFKKKNVFHDFLNPKEDGVIGNIYENPDLL